MLDSKEIIRKIINSSYPENPEMSDVLEEFQELLDSIRGQVPSETFLALDNAANKMSCVSFDYGVLYGLYLYKQVLDIPSVAEHLFKTGTLYQDADDEEIKE